MTTVGVGCSNDLQSGKTVPASSDFVFEHPDAETWLKWENDNRNWYPIVQHGWGTTNLLYFALTGTETDVVSLRVELRISN